MFSEDKKESIAQKIEKISKEYGISFIDAIIHLSEETGIEIEAIALEIKKNQKITSQLQIEAEDLNYLPKTARLF
jgi:hypothetical protein